MTKRAPEGRPILAALLLILTLTGCDQLVKALVIACLPLGERFDLVEHLALYHAQNSGIAFSMLASFHDWGLTLLTLIVIAFIVVMWWLAAANTNWLAHGGYLMVLGGAFGNLIDRIRLSYVTDYILFYVGEWSFAVFNLADTFITLGCGTIIIHEIAVVLRAKKQQKI